MTLESAILKNRRPILVTLSVVALGLAGITFVLATGARVAVGLGMLGTVWELWREFGTTSKADLS
jgi:hypothetical protein